MACFIAQGKMHDRSAGSPPVVDERLKVWHPMFDRFMPG
jgi:hypothetical protein